MTSRYRRGDAVTRTPQGWEWNPQDFSVVKVRMALFLALLTSQVFPSTLAGTGRTNYFDDTPCGGICIPTRTLQVQCGA